MADTVTSRTLIDTDTRCVHLFTNHSVAGAGETSIVKIDVSALSGYVSTASLLNIRRINWTIPNYGTVGGSVKLEWDATTDVTALILSGTGEMKFVDEYQAFVSNNAGTGITGDLLLTTIGFTANSAYSILIECRKTGTWTY